MSNHARRGRDITANPKEEITEAASTSFSVSYALSPKLRVEAIIPHERITAPKTDLASGDRFVRHFSGLGDAIILASLLPYVSSSTDRMVIAATIGLRLPTGDAQPDHDWGYGNSRDPVLQSGYGTLDPLWGLSMSRRIAKFGIQAAAMGRISGGTNVYEYRYANEFQGILGIEYPVNHWLDTGLMGALITSGHDYDHDKKVANTGGLWGYLIPRFVFKTTGVQVESSVQIPVYTFVNGGQLVSDAVFSTGLRFNLTRTATTLLATRETLGAPLHERASLGDFARLQPCVNCDITSVLPAEKWTLVEFMSDVCGACKDFDPVIKQFASDYPDVAVRQFDYLTATDEQIARYDIVETPTVILFDPSGQQVERVVGADLASIKRRLEK